LNELGTERREWSITQVKAGFQNAVRRKNGQSQMTEKKKVSLCYAIKTYREVDLDTGFR
jgi:hypothetical protein